MKWVAIFLLFSNVLYLGWEIDRETSIKIRNSPSVINIPASADKLQLISEIERQLELRERPVLNDPVIEISTDEQMPNNDDLVTELPDILIDGGDEVTVNIDCFRYGPMPDENIARGLQEWFQTRNFDSFLHFTEDRGSQLYWIYLAPQQSREGALALIEEIESKGIGDFRLINRGDLENAVSLGLYSSREAVNNRLRELNEVGFVPVIVPYSDVTRIYWLDVKFVNASPLAESLRNGVAAQYNFEPLNCSDISAL